MCWSPPPYGYGDTHLSRLEEALKGCVVLSLTHTSVKQRWRPPTHTVLSDKIYGSFPCTHSYPQRQGSLHLFFVDVKVWVQQQNKPRKRRRGHDSDSAELEQREKDSTDIQQGVFQGQSAEEKLDYVLKKYSCPYLGGKR